MKCFYHPGIEAITTCSMCGRAISQPDAVDVAVRSLWEGFCATGWETAKNITVVSLKVATWGLIGRCYTSFLGIICGGVTGLTSFRARKQILYSHARQNDYHLQLPAWPLATQKPF